MEIERKFVLDKLPPLTPKKEIDVYQGYISVEPEVRIRSYEVISGKDKGHKDYLLTVKGNGSLSREEIETYVSEQFFNQAAAFLQHPLIHKRHFKYDYHGHILECSIVDEGMSSSFIYGEVEFQSEEAAERFEWPFKDMWAWDVTDIPTYKMKNYWTRTRMTVDENVIKGFNFPTFDEWERMNRSYRAKIGEYCCEIKTFSWGQDECTYTLAIANSDVPQNIWVDRVISKSVRCHHSNTELLRQWYETSIKEAQEEWRTYIMKKYLK